MRSLPFPAVHVLPRIAAGAKPPSCRVSDGAGRQPCCRVARAMDPRLRMLRLPICAMAALAYAAVGNTGGGKGVGVEGRQLTLDSRPWIPKGAGLGAFTNATFYRHSRINASTCRGVNRGFNGAACHFGPGTLSALKDWGVDAVRLLVSQPGLDPTDTLHSSYYVESVLSGVRMAVEAGLVVLVAMQNERHSGEKEPQPMPTNATLRAWDTLLPSLCAQGGNKASDANHIDGMDATTGYIDAEYVMLELFNEPRLQPSDENWDVYISGNLSFVGHQQLINHIRSYSKPLNSGQGEDGEASKVVNDRSRGGCRNVLVADGLGAARTLQAPIARLLDPLAKPSELFGTLEEHATEQFGVAEAADSALAFAVHPYFTEECCCDAVAWNACFNQVASELPRPSLITEWFANSQGPFDNSLTYELPRQTKLFLEYVGKGTLSLWFFAFDVVGTSVLDFAASPNNWTNFGPGPGMVHLKENGAGAGQQIKLFLNGSLSTSLSLSR